MWLEWIGEITTALVAGGAAGVTVLYLAKTLLKQKLAEGLENYKKELAKELHGFATQFSRLDQQRADAVMEIHRIICGIEQLVIWESSAAGTALISANPEGRTMQVLNQAWEGIVKLEHALSYHSLLLDQAIYARVTHWSAEMMKLVSAIGNEIEPLRIQAEIQRNHWIKGKPGLKPYEINTSMPIFLTLAILEES